MTQMKAKATPKVHRILIVDDHPVLRRGVRNILADESGLSVVGEAPTAAEALVAIRETNPDLVLVDITLEDGSGLDLIKRISEEHPSVGMLVLSMHDEALYAERASCAGADGYVNKSEPAERLIAAVRKVLHGETSLSTAMTDRLVGRAVQGGTRPSGVSSLSDRELEVFTLIGQGCSTSHIAQRLHLSVKTVETHRERIKAKLGVENASELSRYAVAWVETSP